MVYIIFFTVDLKLIHIQKLIQKTSWDVDMCRLLGFFCLSVCFEVENFKWVGSLKGQKKNHLISFIFYMFQNLEYCLTMITVSDKLAFSCVFRSPKEQMPAYAW